MAHLELVMKVQADALLEGGEDSCHSDGGLLIVT